MAARNGITPDAAANNLVRSWMEKDPAKKFQVSLFLNEQAQRMDFLVAITDVATNETLGVGGGPTVTSAMLDAINDHETGQTRDYEANAWRGRYGRRGGDPWQAERDEQERARQRRAAEKSVEYDATRTRLLASLTPMEFHELKKLGVNLNDLESEVVATDYSLTTGEVVRLLRVYPGVGVTETGHSTRIWVDPAFLRAIGKS